MLLRLLIVSALVLLAAPAAMAGPDATRDALDRLDELLELRIDDGRIPLRDTSPVMLVSARPFYEESAPWFGTRVAQILQERFGGASLRICEACMVPRAFVEDGHMAFQTGPIGLDEVVRLDDQTRGQADPARAAVWVDEWQGGVSVRIVDLRTGRVIYAQNVDPFLVEYKNTRRMYTFAEEYERRARGESVTQAFVDFSLYPGQHISLDFTDQWGKRNSSLSGVTFSLLDPVAGVGAVHYQRLQLLNTLVGAQVVISVPTALVASLGDDTGEVIDPLLTVVGVIRVPFGRSNYGALATVSTNGAVGVGVSLMNIRLLPVIP